jgi:hypothetical protein
MVLFLGSIPAVAKSWPAVTVEKTSYHGWPNVYRMSNGTIQLLITADVGPRIIWYGFAGGQNEFHEFSDQAGKTGGTEYRSYGGHRLWVSPEVERTYFPDNAPVRVIQKEGAVIFTAPVEAASPGTHLQKEIEVHLSPNGTHVNVIHRITNLSAQPTLMSPWGLSSMEQGGVGILPLPPKVRWNKAQLLPESLIALWSYTDLSDPRWSIGSKYLFLKADAAPVGNLKEQMTGIFNAAGWIAYYRNHHVFVERVQVEKAAKYPDFGCNFEMYTEPGFLELETLGPLIDLQPGATVLHSEDWWLVQNVPEGSGDTWVDTEVLPRIEQAR